MKLHLAMSGAVWCDEPDGDEDATEDPRDATCEDCLKRAAAYGAAAAMRYAAVEAGGARDPELVRERDTAMRQLNAMQDALELQHVFFCTGCMKIYRSSDRALNVNKMSWCDKCAPHRRQPA